MVIINIHSYALTTTIAAKNSVTCITLINAAVAAAAAYIQIQ